MSSGVSLYLLFYGNMAFVLPKLGRSMEEFEPGCVSMSFDMKQD
jgi:hypothetical protein